MVTTRLTYASFNNIYVLPVFHLLLRGVLRDFWVDALRVGSNLGLLSKATKEELVRRGPGVVRTSEFSNKYKNIVKHYSDLKMADWLAFADAMATCMLQGMMLGDPEIYSDDIRDKLTRAVHGMHEAVVFFCRPTYLSGEQYDVALDKHH